MANGNRGDKDPGSSAETGIDRATDRADRADKPDRPEPGRDKAADPPTDRDRPPGKPVAQTTLLGEAAKDKAKETFKNLREREREQKEIEAALDPPKPTEPPRPERKEPGDRGNDKEP